MKEEVSGDSRGEVADPAILDPQTREVLERIENDPFLDPEAMSVPQMRLAFDRFYRELGYPALAIDRSEDVDIPGKAGVIRARLYHPPSRTPGPLPVLIFFHGGGMMMGSIDAYDGLCRRLCNRSGCIVLSSSYRLAPEDKFPAPVEDGMSAIAWGRRHARSFGGDPDRIAIGGESGGGTIAAAVAGSLRDRGSDALKFQLLINPALGVLRDSGSMKRYARGFFFEPEALDWFVAQYLPDAAAAMDPAAYPILAQDFSGLPPTYLVIAGCDILRDVIELYERRLRAAGVAVASTTYEHTIHGFTCMAAVIDAGVRAIDECGNRLRAALTP